MVRSDVRPVAEVLKELKCPGGVTSGLVGITADLDQPLWPKFLNHSLCRSHDVKFVPFDIALDEIEAWQADEPLIESDAGNRSIVRNNPRLVEILPAGCVFGHFHPDKPSSVRRCLIQAGDVAKP